MSDPFLHVPVLPAEVLQYLDPQPGQTIVDATVGTGGHARLLAGRVVPGGLLIGKGQVHRSGFSLVTGDIISP